MVECRDSDCRNQYYDLGKYPPMTVRRTLWVGGQPQLRVLGFGHSGGFHGSFKNSKEDDTLGSYGFKRVIPKP